MSETTELDKIVEGWVRPASRAKPPVAKHIPVPPVKTALPEAIIITDTTPPTSHNIAEPIMQNVRVVGMRLPLDDVLWIIIEFAIAAFAAGVLLSVFVLGFIVFVLGGIGAAAS